MPDYYICDHISPVGDFAAFFRFVCGWGFGNSWGHRVQGWRQSTEPVNCSSYIIYIVYWVNSHALLQSFPLICPRTFLFFLLGRLLEVESHRFRERNLGSCCRCVRSMRVCGLHIWLIRVVGLLVCAWKIDIHEHGLHVHIDVHSDMLALRSHCLVLRWKIVERIVRTVPIPIISGICVFIYCVLRASLLGSQLRKFIKANFLFVASIVGVKKTVKSDVPCCAVLGTFPWKTIEVLLIIFFLLFGHDIEVKKIDLLLFFNIHDAFAFVCCDASIFS